MKILFIGYSNVLKKRILPIIDQLNLEEVHIARYKDDKSKDKPSIKTKLKFYSSYEEAFQKSDAELCYITSVNSDHFSSTTLSLEKGKHTIVDKPICLSYEQFLELKKSAEDRGLLLAEALVYSYHPQFESAKELIGVNKAQIDHIVTCFSVPPFEDTNFRYRKDLGGGALNDLGPYAVSVGRLFFAEEPKTVSINKTDHLTGVDSSFDIILSYLGGKSVIGHFGFTTEYTNYIELMGTGMRMKIDPAFTVPQDMCPVIKYVKNNKDYIEVCDEANSFLLFFKDVMTSLKKKNYKKFTKSAELDCKTLDRLRYKEYK